MHNFYVATSLSASSQELGGLLSQDQLNDLAEHLGLAHGAVVYLTDPEVYAPAGLVEAYAVAHGEHVQVQHSGLSLVKFKHSGTPAVLCVFDPSGSPQHILMVANPEDFSVFVGEFHGES